MAPLQLHPRFHENSALGLPLARPVNFICRTGHSKRRLPRRVSLGPGCPCGTRHGEGGARSRKVEFPDGSLWYNWNNPALTYRGGSTAVVKAPLSELPMFVRAGSFIPQYTHKSGQCRRL